MVTAALGRWRKIAALSDVCVQVSLAHITISKTGWVDGEKGCQGQVLASPSRGKPTVCSQGSQCAGLGKRACSVLLRVAQTNLGPKSHQLKQVYLTIPAPGHSAVP